MDKQSFSKVVDESLHASRRKLLDAYAEGIPTNSPAESGSNSQQLQQLNAARISQRDPTGSVSPLGSSSKNLPVVVTRRSQTRLGVSLVGFDLWKCENIHRQYYNFDNTVKELVTIIEDSCHRGRVNLVFYWSKKFQGVL